MRVTMSSDYLIVAGTRRSVHIPQARVLKRSEIMEKLKGGGGIGVYFQPWDFDFLATPVHVPGGAILEYVAAAQVAYDTSNKVKGTYYSFM